MTIGDERFKGSIESVATQAAEKTATKKIKEAFTLEQRRIALNLNGPYCSQCDRHLDKFRELLETRIKSCEMGIWSKVEEKVKKSIGTHSGGNKTEQQPQSIMMVRIKGTETRLSKVGISSFP